MDSHGVKLMHHEGTWRAVDHTEIEGHTFWLMKPDSHGTSPDQVIVDDQGIPVLSGCLFEDFCSLSDELADKYLQMYLVPETCIRMRDKFLIFPEDE